MNRSGFAAMMPANTVMCVRLVCMRNKPTVREA